MAKKREAKASKSPKISAKEAKAARKADDAERAAASAAKRARKAVEKARAAVAEAEQLAKAARKATAKHLDLLEAGGAGRADAAAPRVLEAPARAVDPGLGADEERDEEVEDADAGTVADALRDATGGAIAEPAAEPAAADAEPRTADEPVEVILADAEGATILTIEPDGDVHLAARTVVELRRLAGERGLTGASRLTKAELIARLSAL